MKDRNHKFLKFPKSPGRGPNKDSLTSVPKTSQKAKKGLEPSLGPKQGRAQK